jgi:hypothetical protein
MKDIKSIEKLSRKYSRSTYDFIKLGSTLAIREKKREYKYESFEILARYNVVNAEDLKKKIKDGLLPEHPAWEDYIELQNIQKEIIEMENDLKTLQQD